MSQAQKQDQKGHVVCDELFALARRSGLWFTFEGHPDGACTITTQSKDQSQDGKRAKLQHHGGCDGQDGRDLNKGLEYTQTLFDPLDFEEMRSLRMLLKP